MLTPVPTHTQMRTEIIQEYFDTYKQIKIT